MPLKKGFLLFLNILICASIFAQTYIKGKITDGIYGDPVPYCIIEIDKSETILANGKGEFLIDSDKKIDSLVFRAPFHRAQVYRLNSDSQDISINLIAYTIFLPLKKSDKDAEMLIGNWQTQSMLKNYKLSSNLQYRKNSVSILKSTDLRRFKRNFNRFYGLLGKRINSYDKDHYLLYSQSTQKNEYKNRFAREEEIESSLFLGTDDPTEISGIKNPYEISLFSDYWRIGKNLYPNPLAGNFSKRYHFKILDSLIVEGSNVKLIQFYPKINKRANKLRGIIFLDEDKSEILCFWAEKAVDTDSKLKLSCEYMDFENLRVPHSVYLVRNLTDIQSYSTLIKLESSENYHQYSFNTDLSKKKYDEVVKDFNDVSLDTSLLFNSNDSLVFNTYEFYRKNPDLQSIYKAVTFGKKIYNGAIPIGKFELDINRIINFNNHEGLRLGLGLEADRSLWKLNHSSVYGAYGFRDERFKFGVSSRFYANTEYWNWIEIKAQNDVFESGASEFEQEENMMFKSESLRRLGISIMDFGQHIESSVNIKIAKYLQGRFGYEFSRLKPTYDYSFSGNQNRSYDYSQINYMLRFAPGEERVRTQKEMTITESPLPVLFLRWASGREGLGSDFNYDQLEFMLKYQKRILGYGTSSIRIQGGILSNSLPYQKMFVVRGGFRNFSVVFHNTFETMGYNEFLADRYLYLFYSHNFGPFFIPFLNHFSSLEMLHNFGIADLSNSQDHDLIDFEIMNKGYLESGLFMNDIIVLKTSGLNTGLGAGFLYRYGAYQFSGFGRNIVFKVSLNLDL